NGADVAAFIKGAARPFANSMATDVYRRLPNDTDVTEFLPLGYDAINLALIEGVEFYHTPRDNLAALDPKSVQHMGDLALNSVRNLAAATKETGESQLVFTDILSRATLVLPQWLGGLTLIVSMFVAAAAFFRVRGGRPIMAALTAPATLVLSVGVAFGLQFLIGAVRPEASYWFARPEAMQAVAYLCAAFAALLALAVVGAGAGRERLIHAGWFWFAGVGAGLYFVAPGASILFAAPLLFYATGALAGFAMTSAGRMFSIAAFIIALIIFAPALHLAELALGLGAVAVFAGVGALVMMVGAPLAVSEEGRAGLAPALAAGGALAVAVIAALLVPAYSAGKPLPLNVQYFLDADAREAKWLLSAAPGEPAPAAMAALAAFERVDIDGLAEGRLAAPAPAAEIAPADIEILSDETVADGRKLRFALAPNGADIMYVLVPEAARATDFLHDGRPGKFGETGDQVLSCLGRACDGAEFEVSLGAGEPADWLVFGGRFGLPDAAGALVAARPDWASPIQNGDVTIVRLKRKL
ncbi:MAG: M28 family peptidase, partial [Parvularculaceae bacterium]